MGCRLRALTRRHGCRIVLRRVGVPGLQPSGILRDLTHRVSPRIHTKVLVGSVGTVLSWPWNRLRQLFPG
jgi:hypothetical protein